MKDYDEHLKKLQEEQTQIKNQLGVYIKKDGGNFLTRDYTDEIYGASDITKDMFIESLGSEMFVNILVVLSKVKAPTFNEELLTLMEEYYEAVNAQEDKRHPDIARIRYNELMENEKDSEAWTKFLEVSNLTGKDEAENF